MVLDKRVGNVVEQGRMALELLRTISEVTNTPYLRPISGAGTLLMDTVVIVRKNKEECLRMAEQVVTIIMALVNICNNSEAELQRSVLSNIAAFAETLQKVLAFVRRQIDKSLIKRVVRHLEDSSLLSECQSALDRAVELFKLQCEVTTISSLAQFQAESNRKNSELCNLLMATESSSTLSTLHSRLSDISLLPGSPQIFHGRDTELQHIVSGLLHEVPSQIAILGTGGVGKSSLSLAALYHPDVAAKFRSERHFIPCESAQSAEDIAAALFNHFTLEEGGDITKAVLQYLSSREGPCVVVLDNLETPWEYPGGRSAVEDLLSHLSAINTVYLVITMRGEERPGKVRWTRPFLRPLSPLSDLAARQVFRDITDAAESDAQLDELLRLTDNLPLAITLMASLVAFEGASLVLERWNSERISMLSEGADKRSNLRTSITMSLSSPRLTAIPDALTLLSLLSVLPDGITDSTLTEMNLPLADVAICRVTLCRTSLAYVDHDRRLKALVPIREHMRAFRPPSPALVSHLQEFFFNLVSLFCKKWARAIGNGLVQRLSADLGNIHSILQISLEDNPPSTEAISCIIDLAHFTQVTYLGSWDFLRSISGGVQNLSDPNLQGRYYVALSRNDAPDTPVESYLTKAIQCFQSSENVSAQAMAYYHLSALHTLQGNTSKALETSKRALSLARRSRDHNVLARVLRRMSGVLHNLGDLRQAWAHTLEAQAHAQVAGDLDTEFLCILNRVSHFITAGNYGRAAALCADLTSLARGLGVENGDHGLDALFMQAEIHLRKTEYNQARRIYLVISEMTSPDGKLGLNHGLALQNLFLVDLGTGANLNHDSVYAIRAFGHNVSWTVMCDINTADVSHRLGDLVGANQMYTQCLTLVRGQDAEITNECFQKLGDNSHAQSQIDSAFQYYVLHLALSRRMEDYDNTHQALRRIGDIFLCKGDDETARSLFTLCLDGFTLMDIHKGRADCFLRLGDLAKGGDGIDAATFWERALPLYERSSQEDRVRQCNERLNR